MRSTLLPAELAEITKSINMPPKPRTSEKSRPIALPEDIKIYRLGPEYFIQTAKFDRDMYLYVFRKSEKGQMKFPQDFLETLKDAVEDALGDSGVSRAEVGPWEDNACYVVKLNGLGYTYTYAGKISDSLAKKLGFRVQVDQ